MDCNKIIAPSNLFWAAFAVNPVADVAVGDDNFDRAFEKMRKELKENNFHVPQLRTNFRNTHEISSIQLDSSSQRGRQLKIKKNIEILTSTLTGESPLYLPVIRGTVHMFEVFKYLKTKYENKRIEYLKGCNCVDKTTC